MKYDGRSEPALQDFFHNGRSGQLECADHSRPGAVELPADEACPPGVSATPAAQNGQVARQVALGRQVPESRQSRARRVSADSTSPEPACLTDGRQVGERDWLLIGDGLVSVSHRGGLGGLGHCGFQIADLVDQPVFQGFVGGEMPPSARLRMYFTVSLLPSPAGICRSSTTSVSLPLSWGRPSSNHGNELVEGVVYHVLPELAALRASIGLNGEPLSFMASDLITIMSKPYLVCQF